MDIIIRDAVPADVPFLARCVMAAVGTLDMAENAEERSVLFSFILLCVLFVSLILLFMEAQRIYAGYGITGVPSPHVHPKKKKGPIGIADMLLSPALIIFVILFFVISLIKQ